MKITRDEIIRMAREAGLEVHPRKEEIRVGYDTLLGIDSTEQLERFAILVAAAEREACAKVCDDMVLYKRVDCATAIRARSNTIAGFPVVVDDTVPPDHLEIRTNG